VPRRVESIYDLNKAKPPANASWWRRSLGVRASGALRNLSRAFRPLSGRTDRYNSGFFINQKRELTSLPVLRYSSGHRKGRLKILSVVAAWISAKGQARADRRGQQGCQGGL